MPVKALDFVLTRVQGGVERLVGIADMVASVQIVVVKEFPVASYRVPPPGKEGVLGEVDVKIGKGRREWSEVSVPTLLCFPKVEKDPVSPHQTWDLMKGVLL